MFTSRRCGSGCLSGAGPARAASRSARAGRPRARGRGRRFAGRGAAAARATRTRSGAPAERRERLDPEAGLALLDEERLSQSDREPSDRGPGRGPLGLARLRPGVHRRPRPEDRRSDRVAVLGGRPRCAASRWNRAPTQARPPAWSSAPVPSGRDSNSPADIDRGRRRRRAGRPRPGEEGRAVDVPGQHRLDRSRAFDRREHDRPRRRLEKRQLEEHGGEHGVGRPVGDRGQQESVPEERIPGLLELGPTDRLDPCDESRAVDLPGFRTPARDRPRPARARAGARPGSG